VSVKVDVVRLEAFMAWLKVAVMVAPTATPVADAAGLTAVTVGAVGGGGMGVLEPPPHPVSPIAAAAAKKKNCLRRIRKTPSSGSKKIPRPNYSSRWKTRQPRTMPLERGTWIAGNLDSGEIFAAPIVNQFI
jgi:hypothetical protein